MPANKKSVLFICLGNICRSPIAEAVFCHVIRENGVQDQWEVDSAAIGSWHVGRSPDRRALAVLEKHGIPTSHKARQIKTHDFSKYDYIFGMDEENMEDLNARAPNNCKAKIELLGTYDPEGELIIRDPYYDHNDQGFEKCYEQSLRCCRAFLEQNS